MYHTMTYVVHSRQSACAPLQNALCGALVGLLMFFLSFPLLWWNEHKAVMAHATLTEGLRLVASSNAEIADSPVLRDQLVRVSGPVAGDTLTDPTFGAATTNALLMQRNTMMFQYVETSHRKSRGRDVYTTYSYTPQWSSQIIDSSRFSDPAYRQKSKRAETRLAARDILARSVRVGDWTIPSAAVQTLANAETRDVDPEEIIERPRSGDRAVVHTSVGDLTVVGGALYRGVDPAHPAVGDEKVTFRVAKAPSAATIIGRATSSGRLEPFLVPGTGKSILLVEVGDLTTEDMFERAHAAAAMETWALRAGGTIFCIVGLALLFNIGPAAVSWIPFIGPLLGGVLGTVTFLIAVVVGLAFALTTIALAWLASRPLTSLLLAGVVIALSVLAARLRRYQALRQTSAAAVSVHVGRPGPGIKAD